MIQDCSPNSDFKWYTTGSLFSTKLQRELGQWDLIFRLQRYCLKWVPVDKSLQGRTPGPSWAHFDCADHSPFPARTSAYNKTKPKMSGFSRFHILNHPWNIINLKCTFPLEGVRVAQSPEAFVSSEECNACRSPFSPKERDLRGPCNRCLFVCGINLLICYTLIIIWCSDSTRGHTISHAASPTALPGPSRTHRC